MAPMRSHFFHLFHTLKTTDKVSFWYGQEPCGNYYMSRFQEYEKNFHFSFNIALSEPKRKTTGRDILFIHQVILIIPETSGTEENVITFAVPRL